MRIFHIAAASDWQAAQSAGIYTRSTVGRSLDDVGYIHAADSHQLTAVMNRYFAEVYGPLALLEIDTDRLSSPVIREQPAPGVEAIYPHIYGPLNLDAVVAVRDITRALEDPVDADTLVEHVEP